MAATVFAMNYAGHNMTDAERFGRIVKLTTGNVDIFETDRLTFQLCEDLTENEYDPETDHLLLSGSPVITAIVVGLITRMYNPDVINLLLWRADDKLYVPRQINLKEYPNAQKESA